MIVGHGATKLVHTTVPKTDINCRHHNGGGMAIGNLFILKEKLMIMDGSMLLISRRKFALHHYFIVYFWWKCRLLNYYMELSSSFSSLLRTGFITYGLVSTTHDSMVSTTHDSMVLLSGLYHPWPYSLVFMSYDLMTYDLLSMTL